MREQESPGVSLWSIAKAAYAKTRGVGRILSVRAIILVVAGELLWKVAHGHFDIFAFEAWELNLFDWAFWIPTIAVFVVAFIFNLWKGVGFALKSELGALARADAPEGTVVDRLRRGSSEKK